MDRHTMIFSEFYVLLWRKKCRVFKGILLFKGVLYASIGTTLLPDRRSPSSEVEAPPRFSQDASEIARLDTGTVRYCGGATLEIRGLGGLTVCVVCTRSIPLPTYPFLPRISMLHLYFT